jgi:hypothetical protein
MAGARVDLLAVAAIACVCCLLEPVVHEGLGHGITAIALGAHFQHVSSVDMAADETHLAAWAVRIIAAAGIVANLVFGKGALIVFWRTRSANANTRYFLWLFGHSNLFVGSGYLLALSFANFGDIQELVAGLPQRTLVQALLTLIGIVIALMTYFHAARTLDEFLGADDSWRRALALTVLPYFVIGTVHTLAGTLNPEGLLLILISAAAASFGGNMPMAWIPFAVRRARSDASVAPLTPVRDPFWLTSAVLSLIILFGVLAPGVPR